MNSYLNRFILRTSIVGLVYTVVIFSFGLGIFAFAFPRTMANLFDATGNARLSAIYHTRIFDRNPNDTQQLYLALARNVDAGRDNEIIRLGKKFFLEISETSREQVITIVDNYIIANTSSPSIIALACPDNELRRAVIRTLLNNGDFANAKQIFSQISSTRPSFAIFEFVGENRTRAIKDIFIAHYNAIYNKGVVDPADTVRELRRNTFLDALENLRNEFDV